MRKRVYVETTIVSYLTARPSVNLIIAAHQEITRQWWQQRRRAYDLFVSQFVVREAGKGDAAAADARLALLADLPQLRVEPEAIALADALVTDGVLPGGAAVDSLHLAMATVHGMDVLLTWNCRHLANADILMRAARYVRRKAYDLPIVCTPEELMGEKEGEP